MIYSTADFAHARCARCHAAIVFGITASGKRMPIDVDATAGGNVLIVGRDVETNAPHLLVRRRDDVVREDDVVYQSHFASCAHADEFRRRR